MKQLMSSSIFEILKRVINEDFFQDSEISSYLRRINTAGVSKSRVSFLLGKLLDLLDGERLAVLHDGDNEIIAQYVDVGNPNRLTAIYDEESGDFLFMSVDEFLATQNQLETNFS